MNNLLENNKSGVVYIGDGETTDIEISQRSSSGNSSSDAVTLPSSDRPSGGSSTRSKTKSVTLGLRDSVVMRKQSPSYTFIAMPDFRIAARRISRFAAAISHSGRRYSSAISPMSASAAFTGIGLLSMKSARLVG